VFCLIGRAVNIFPISYVANFGRKKKITKKMQFVMWFAGLRGAIPFALAFNMPVTGPMWNREVIVTTTLSVCLISTLILGGLTEPLLKRLNLSTSDRSSSSITETGFLSDEDETLEFTFLNHENHSHVSSVQRTKAVPGASSHTNMGYIHGRWREVDTHLMKIFTNQLSSPPAAVRSTVIA
jgi:sodium/hydrogen exchanger 8